MTIYIIIAFLLLWTSLSKIADKDKRWIIFFICLLGLCRGETVGCDIHVYLLNISKTTWNPNTWSYYTDFEPGYNILIAAWKSLFSAPMLFLGLCNTFFVVSLYIFAKKQVYRCYVYFFVVWMLGYYMQSYNIMRQYTAIAFMLLALKDFDFESPTLKQLGILSICIVLNGLLIHNSVLVLLCLPFYYICKIERLVSNKLAIAALLATSYLFYADVINIYLAPYADLFLLNEKATSYMHNSLTTEQDEKYSFFRILLDNTVLIAVLIRFKKLDPFVYLLVIGQVLVNVFAPLNPLFVRVSNCLFILGSICYANILSRQYIIRKSDFYNYRGGSYDRILRLGLYLYLIIIFSNILYKNYGMIVPYTLNIE